MWLVRVHKEVNRAGEGREGVDEISEVMCVCWGAKGLEEKRKLGEVSRSF